MEVENVHIIIPHCAERQHSQNILIYDGIYIYFIYIYIQDNCVYMRNEYRASYFMVLYRKNM